MESPSPVGSLARGRAGLPRGAGAQSTVRATQRAHPVDVQSALASFAV